MSTTKTVNHKKETLETSKATRKKLRSVLTLFKNKEMFPEKVERAREMFKGFEFAN